MTQDRAEEQRKKMMVDWAMSVFAVKQLTVEFDKGAQVWDIETRTGWKVCKTPEDLARLAKDVQRGDA